MSVYSHIIGTAPSSDTDTLVFTRSRVARFVSGLAGLFALLLLIDLIPFEHGPTRLELAHGAAVAILAGLALLARRVTRLRALALLEMVATALIGVLGAVFVSLGVRGGVYAGPAFGVALVLIVRSAIVPCSAWRTVAVGLATAVPVTAGYVSRGDPKTLEPGFVAVWLLLFVAASAVISRVIYGLQRRLRETDQLGQYLLEERLGEGGMGVVYRAQHALLRRPTAVKVFEAGRDRQPGRFEREVRMTSRLTHPNTITVFDYGNTPDGHFYYAMELLDGADLAEIVEVGGPQPASRTVHVLSAIASALTEAHDIGLIHRDIKPQNIMLCRHGGMLDTPKLLDFGLVRDLAVADQSTDDVVIGTPLYLSPEAISDPEAVDASSDLYALGAVGYFLLTGSPVFEGKTAIDVCRQHLDAEPEPPSRRLGAAIDGDLEAVILACLAKDRGDRPASAAELRRRLAACEVEPWTAESARRWWQSHRKAIEGLRSGDGASESMAMRIDARDR